MAKWICPGFFFVVFDLKQCYHFNLKDIWKWLNFERRQSMELFMITDYYPLSLLAVGMAAESEDNCISSIENAFFFQSFLLLQHFLLLFSCACTQKSIKFSYQRRYADACNTIMIFNKNINICIYWMRIAYLLASDTLQLSSGSEKNRSSMQNARRTRKKTKKMYNTCNS